MLSSSNKLYAILPNLVAQCVKLDIAKHYYVLLCRSCKSEISIFLVVADDLCS